MKKQEIYTFINIFILIFILNISQVFSQENITYENIRNNKSFLENYEGIWKFEGRVGCMVSDLKIELKNGMIKIFVGDYNNNSFTINNYKKFSNLVFKNGIISGHFIDTEFDNPDFVYATDFYIVLLDKKHLIFIYNKNNTNRDCLPKYYTKR